MKAIWLAATAAAFLLGCSPDSDLMLGDTTQYPRLQETLAHEIGKVVSEDAEIEEVVTRTKAFRRILAGGSEPELLMMTQTETEPWVSLAGFYAIRRKHPGQAPLAATNICMHSEWIVKLMSEPQRYLSELDDKNASFQCLDTVAKQATGLKKTNLLILAEVFHKNGSLGEWFEDNEQAIEPLWLAAILGEIFPTPGNQQPTPKMRAALQSCATRAGFPRYTYVFLADKAEPNFINVLTLALSDLEIEDPEISWLVHTNRMLIKREIDIDSLGMSAARRKLIADALQ